MAIAPTPPDNQEEELTNQTNAASELRTIIKTIFGDRPESNDTEIIDFYAKAVTESILDRLEAEGPKKKKESEFSINMGIKHNPPPNTTRTNLYRQGYNAAITDQAALLAKIREELT